jgi:hypothetical protein
VDGTAAVSAAVTVRRDAAFKALSRSEKLSLICRNNAGNSRNITRSFLKRRLLLFAEDRGAVQAGERLMSALLDDKVDATAAETALAEQAALCRTLTLLCIAEMARSRETDHERAANARKEAGRHISNERMAVQALGLERRARTVPSLTEFLESSKS